MDYEVALRRAFDYQRFIAYAPLSSLIEETGKRLKLVPEGSELHDESLDIWAAGQPYPVNLNSEKAKHTTEDI